MNITQKALPLLIILLMATIVNAKNLVILGFDGRKLPSAENSFDRILRQQLSVTPDAELTDDLKTRQMRHYVNFDDNHSLSIEDINTLRKYVTDSTYFLWGTLDEFKISPKRKFFFKAQIQGELSVELNLYNITEHKSSYSGKIKAVVAEDRGIVIFTPVGRSVHISAIDRTDILEKVENEAARKTCTIIAAAIRSDLARADFVQSKQNPSQVSAADTVQTPGVSNDKTVPAVTDSSVLTPVKPGSDTSKQIKKP